MFRRKELTLRLEPHFFFCMQPDAKKYRINFVANGSIRITDTELMKNIAVKERMKFACGFKGTGLRTVQHVREIQTVV